MAERLLQVASGGIRRQRATVLSEGRKTRIFDRLPAIAAYHSMQRKLIMTHLSMTRSGRISRCALLEGVAGARRGARGDNARYRGDPISSRAVTVLLRA